MAGVEYRVIDRSILLPAYRRFLVDPVLPLLPRTLDPNTITHAGHVANLTGMILLWVIGQQVPWACVVAIVGLQLYLWCDNADGAHARRTQQTSVYGEFLDHGLDQLNTAYIGCLTAMAMAVSPAWFVATVLLTSGAAVVTYWEQSVTGVFRLGLLNQVESLFVLSGALAVTAFMGPDFWARELYAGVSIRGVMLGWMTATILFGAARALWRVAQAEGAASTAPIASFIGFSALIVAVVAADCVPWWAALAVAAALDVFYGMRMLALRFARSAPRLEPIVVIGGLVATLVLLAARFAPAVTSGPAVMIGLAAVLVALTIREARRGLTHLRAATVVVVLALGTALVAAPAQADPRCRPLAEVLAAHPEGVTRVRAGDAGIERITFPRSKSSPVLAAKERACADTPEGALALGVLPRIECETAARAWLRAFETDTVLENADAVLDAMAAGAKVEHPPAGLSLRDGIVRVAVLIERDGVLRLVRRDYSVGSGATTDDVIAELRPPRSWPATSGPLPEQRHDVGDDLDHRRALAAVRAAARAARLRP